MKTRILVLPVVFMLILMWPIVHSQTLVNRNVRENIERILSEPSKVYDLDLQKNQVIFDRIDNWFGDHFDFNKAIKKQHNSEFDISYKLEFKENRPISLDGKKMKGLSVKTPFNAWYDKDLQKRKFKKDISIPTMKTLDDNEIIRIGKAFIVSNQFCSLTRIDTLTTPTVVSLRKQQIGQDGKIGNELTILHRLELKRKIDGLDVINSKQIVEFHPETREILSYKNVSWTPISERSGRNIPYVSLESITSKVDSLLTRSNNVCEITKVKPGMFQDDNIIFPVLELYIDCRVSEVDSTRFSKVLVINLVEDIQVDRKTKSLKFEPERISR